MAIPNGMDGMGAPTSVGKSSSRRSASATRPRVLVVEDEHDLNAVLRAALETGGYEVISASRGKDAIRRFAEQPIDLVLLDLNLPDVDGLDLCIRLRQTARGDAVPILIMTARSGVDMKLRGIGSGADDYITKPFDLDELLARVAMHLRRSRREQQLNPLTLLPGNPAIETAIEDRLAESGPFAVLYVDLDNFKAYNDQYGFHAGDRAIQALAAIVREAAELHAGAQSSASGRSATDDNFVGHVGGDDFVVVCAAEMAEAICRAIAARFDAAVPSFYDAADAARGYFAGRDRQGQAQRYRLLSVSIAGVIPGRRPFGHPAEIAHVAAQVKGFLKQRTEPGSKYLIDRRTSG